MRFNALHNDGFALVPALVDADTIQVLSNAIDASNAAVSSRRGAVYAARNMLETLPALRRAIAADRFTQTIADAFHALLGETTKPFAVRAILFDKRAEANWHVGWHQDTAIAVASRVDTPGFGPWSVKAGVIHVRPPADVLARMLAVRIHLDDCGEQNGPLRVVPGSHRSGLLEPDAVRRMIDTAAKHTAGARAGEALIMSPLLLHASSPSAEPARRRVIHIEYACDPLPAGLHWHTPPND